MALPILPRSPLVLVVVDLVLPAFESPTGAGLVVTTKPSFNETYLMASFHHFRVLAKAI